MAWLLLVLLPCFPARAAELKDVVYAEIDGVLVTLDANVPDGTGPFPAAILVHGGGWVAGDKDRYHSNVIIVGCVTSASGPFLL